MKAKIEKFRKLFKIS